MACEGVTPRSTPVCRIAKHCAILYALPSAAYIPDLEYISASFSIIAKSASVGRRDATDGEIEDSSRSLLFRTASSFDMLFLFLSVGCTRPICKHYIVLFLDDV